MHRRHSRRRRDSSVSSFSSDLDSFQGAGLRVHRRPLDHDIRRSHSHAGVRHRRDKNGDVFIDIHNKQRLEPHDGRIRSHSRDRDRNRSRMRSTSRVREREDVSDIEENILRKIRLEKRIQEDHEERVRIHQLQLQQQWAAPPPRPRSTSPVGRSELRLLEEKMKRQRLEEQLRKQENTSTFLAVPQPRESKSRSRSRSKRRHTVIESSSDSDSSDGEDVRLEIKRARSRGRNEAGREFELKRLLRKEHDERARRHLKEAIKLEQMEALEREKEEEEREAKLREKMEFERAKAEAEEAEKKQKVAKLKREAIEEHLRMEAAKEKQEREAKEKKEKELEERMKPLLLAQGYTEQEAEDIIKGEAVTPPAQVKAVKVHSDDISPEALDRFDLVWEWEKPRSSGWIIIHHDIPQGMIDQLMDLTRQLRQRLLAPPSPPPPAPGRQGITVSRVTEREKDRIYLVRKKKQGGIGRLFSFA